MAAETLQHPVIICTTCLEGKNASDIRKGTRKCLDCLRAGARERMRAKLATPEGRASQAAYTASRRASGADDRTKQRQKAAARAGRTYVPRAERLAKAKARNERLQAERSRKASQREAERKGLISEKPWLCPSLTDAEKFKMRYSMDAEFNLKQKVRSALRRKRQGLRLENIVRGALVREGSSPKAEAFLGYNMAALHTHLGRQFGKRMTWAAFLAGDIHIDHIVPLSSFDLSDPDELRRAWCMTNLRPVWASDNLAKGAKAIYLV